MSGVNESNSTEKLLLGAVVVSLLLHLLAFSLWRVGQAQGWWQNMAMPRWMQKVSNAMMPLTPKKAALDIAPQTQLAFVDVDPALATPEPPKKPMFQGARNTLAANREIKAPSDKPNIDGTQERYLKTIENAKPTPLHAAATPPQPQPQNPARQSAPKQIGDLAMVRPSDNPADQAQPQPQPYQRPRTLAEAQAKYGVPGQKSRQVGGVGNVQPDIALDVQGTPLGDYIARMVDAVRTQWYKLLENQTPDVTGKVVLHFRLHPDGRISDMKMMENEVSELLETVCEQAIYKPAPYEKWPREMRLALPNDYDDITFTFFYEPY